MEEEEAVDELRNMHPEWGAEEEEDFWERRVAAEREQEEGSEEWREYRGRLKSQCRRKGYTGNNI